MTNEEAAVKLGYEKGDSGWWIMPDPNKDAIYIHDINFTTSIDAIAEEIERRDLFRQCGGSKIEGYVAELRDRTKRDYIVEEGKTAALALCKALISYVERDNG